MSGNWVEESGCVIDKEARGKRKKRQAGPYKKEREVKTENNKTI